jgi:hypothetical protein
VGGFADLRGCEACGGRAKRRCENGERCRLVNKVPIPWRRRYRLTSEVRNGNAVCGKCHASETRRGRSILECISVGGFGIFCLPDWDRGSGWLSSYGCRE